MLAVNRGDPDPQRSVASRPGPVPIACHPPHASLATVDRPDWSRQDSTVYVAAEAGVAATETTNPTATARAVK
jgi:hypothetical protein